MEKKKRDKNWRLEHPNYAKEKSKQWRINHPEWSKDYYQNHREEIKTQSKKWQANNHERWTKIRAKANKKYKIKLKNEIHQSLGGKCANPFNLPHPDWCNDSEVLQIDHVHGGGTKERSIYGRDLNYYRHILQQIKFGSKDYQLLCANCNFKKRYKNHEDNKFVV